MHITYSNPLYFYVFWCLLKSEETEESQSIWECFSGRSFGQSQPETEKINKWTQNKSHHYQIVTLWQWFWIFSSPIKILQKSLRIIWFYWAGDNWLAVIHKLLSVDLIWGHFLCCGRVLLRILATRQTQHRYYAISRFGVLSCLSDHSNADCMNSSFKEHLSFKARYFLCVISRDFVSTASMKM